MFELITDSILAIISEFWGVSVRKTVYHKEMDKIVVHESVITTNYCTRILIRQVKFEIYKLFLLKFGNS